MSDEPGGRVPDRPAPIQPAGLAEASHLRLALDVADAPAELPPAAGMPAADLPARRPRVRPRVRIRDELLLWLRTIITAAIYAALIVTFLFQVARVEGQSMAPTLQNQDRVIVNKLAYHLGDPRRGDIVMLYYPIDPGKSFVKRVIAEAGDTVRISDGIVYVNSVRQPDAYVPADYRSHDDWGPAVIPEGYYFVMGDHRNDSSDSRQWGMVPKKYIVGRIELRWWPVPRAKLF
ncbi:MAG TPA: signal peptidase I [Vicinamibacterales bacterium]